MATVLTTIYPPQVETFMPSFCYNSPAVIWFNVTSYDKDRIGQIKYIHISLIDQRNNKNVFAGTNNGNTVYPQYYPVVFNQNTMYDAAKKMYKVTIPPQVLKTSPYYNPGQYYKVQLRFDLTGSANFPAYSNTYSNPTSFFSWNSSTSKATANALELAAYTNYNENNFSEWSTGTLLKPILIPELSLQNFSTSTTAQINPSTDVTVAGRLQFKKSDGDVRSYVETEQLSWYQIQVLSNNKTIIYYDSDKVYTNSQNAMNQINYKVDMSMLTKNTKYYMRIVYETSSGYSKTIDYSIKIVDYSDSTSFSLTKTIDEENGIITLNIGNLNIDSAQPKTGYVVVRRSSHYSNFTHWDLIGAYNITSINNLTVVDNTIESMTGYRYQIQYIEDNKIYSPQYIEANDILHCDFYGGILSDNDKMLKITFDFQVSSRANAPNRTKIDTLGGQYPIFTQNSKLKYHTYSITSKISSEDNGELFLPKQELFGSQYYKYRYNPDTSLPHNAQCQSIKPNNDWLYEREYRDAVEEWLNNGKPKLFRSMTEGNMIVMLDNVGLTPDTVLGRRLYSFNATMYEIGDGKNIDSLVSFGLFNLIDER